VTPWACLASIAVLVPTGASAHAFAQRYDLPLPLWHYLTGAGAAVALSFIVAILFLRRPPGAIPSVRLALPTRAVSFLKRILSLLSIGCLLLLLTAGLLGDQGDWDSNLLPVTVWVIWWVGVTFVSALVGNIWPVIDPWRAVGQLIATRKPPLPWPRRLGAWPAVILFLIFAWAELAWTENAMPRRLAVLTAGYSLLTWSGMALFGVETWRANADPFTHFFGLLGHFAPFAVDHGTTFVLRPFGAGLSQANPPSRATTAFVLLTLASVTFDGIAETPLWEAIVGEITGLLYGAGIIDAIGYTAASSLVKTLAL
jgi:hypothetical protein